MTLAAAPRGRAAVAGRAARHRLLFAALLLAVVVYLVGTLWRAGREERLLRDSFGAAYEEYSARVPRLLPRRTQAKPSQTKPGQARPSP